MTTLEKLDTITRSVVVSISSPAFQEMRTLGKDQLISFVPSSNWGADVTFYIRGKAAVYRQDASFTGASFEALVEEIWAAYNEVYTQRT